MWLPEYEVVEPAQLLTLCRRKVTFVDKEGDEHTFGVADGDNLLDIAQSEDLEMEGTFMDKYLFHYVFLDL